MIETQRYKQKLKRTSIILIFYIITISDTVFFSTNANSSITRLSQISILIFSLILLIIETYKNRGKIKINNVLVFSGVAIVLTSGMLLNEDISFGYLLKFSLFVSGLIITKNMKIEDFSKIYIKIMLFLALYSLIFYLMTLNIGSFMSILSNNAPIMESRSGKLFYNLIFTNIPFDGYSRLRNWGLFWEPGAFQVFLNIAIMLLLFVEKREERKKVKLIVLIITVITTLSTTGFITLLTIILAYLLSGGRVISSKNMKTKIFIVVISAIGLIFILTNETIMFRVFGKLAQGSESLTFAARLVSITYNLQIFIKNPILGVGPSNYVLYFENLVNANPAIGGMQTNTILGMFAIYGIVVAFFFTYLLWKFCKRIGLNILVSSFLFIAFIFMFFSEDFNYSLFAHTLVFWGLQNDKNINTRSL